jgi:uncharacterized protein (DUF362 family)
MAGQVAGAELRFDVEIRIDDLARFIRVFDHAAQLTGSVTCARLGGTFPIRDGRFNLFSSDPRTGERQMAYEFRFTAAGGQVYFLQGRKAISDEPGKIDVVEDMTRLATTLYKGSGSEAPVHGTGDLRFSLRDLPSLVASMQVLGASSWRQRAAGLTAFVSFAYGALRDTYLRDIRLFYDTQYENLVLAGALASGGGSEAPFFFVSGAHDKGFPWGDDEIFWDVLVAAGGRKFAITDRVLEGLEIDIASGSYRYQGPLFEITEGFSASFSQMRAGAPHLAACDAEIEIEFESRAFDTVPFPFPLLPHRVRRMSSKMVQRLRELLPGERMPGIHITPHAVKVRRGSVRIGGERWTIGAAAGEAERGAFRNLKEPTTLYSYVCGVRPARGAFRVQILTRTMRDEPQWWAKDRFDACAGYAVSRTASAEYAAENGGLKVQALPPAGAGTLFRKLGEPVIEVNNDHFPTAVFQRRIIRVQDPSGEECFALEEDMTRMRLEAVNSSRSVTVAAIRGENKLLALDRVLDETGFDTILAERLAASGRSRQGFTIAIKPNFMFAYNKRDASTYTDPALVDHLVGRLRRLGFERILVVEAQSTYGEYFDRRSVREVAQYLGFDGRSGYEVVDMTEDAVEQRQFGPRLGLHPFSRAWRDAGFRISFAKNKTHAYSYYTLTLKNIYGALPLGNKFKEYHCHRDIYHTALEYLEAFPVDYGLIDGWVSADGPFGIFADPAPNETRTIIGGADLVAVDWVGATKMGVDPMISKYMQIAVERFGKPAIRLVGDANPYRPWVNVPVALALFTNKGLDAEYHFGNLFYTTMSEMDASHFRHKSTAAPIRLLRRLTEPLRRTFFVRTGENPSLGNRVMSWLLYRMGF